MPLVPVITLAIGSLVVLGMLYFAFSGPSPQIGRAHV